MLHTPGLWVVDDANPELVAQLVEGIYQYIASIAIGNFCSTERSGKEEEANARLSLEVLQTVEWVPWLSGGTHCPWCDGLYPDHKADCARQAAIAAVEEGP